MGNLVSAGGESGETSELSLGYWRIELERVSKDCPQVMCFVWLWWSVKIVCRWPLGVRGKTSYYSLW